MLTPCKIQAYCNEFHPIWACEMPDNCPPEDICVPDNHIFHRLAKKSSVYDENDFVTYAEANPERDWGEQLPLAVGLSLIESESKARKNLKLPMFRQYHGIIMLTLNPKDGVVKQTGVHRSHFTWWRTKHFKIANLSMLQV